MVIKPAYSLDEITLEEILEDLKTIRSEYEKIKGGHKDEKPCCIESEEKRLTEHVVNKILPVAKSLSYFKHIHLEPKEVYFTDLGESAIGDRVESFIRLDKSYCGDSIIPSILSHETIHTLGGMTGEPLTMLLGMEVDARMASRGYECHRISLCRYLRDMTFQVSFIKAKSVNQVSRWKSFVKELYGDELPEERIEKNIEYYEKMEDMLIFAKLSDYTLLPYLSIKGAVKTGTDHTFEEYELSDALKREKVEIPALIKIWEEINDKHSQESS